MANNCHWCETSDEDARADLRHRLRISSKMQLYWFLLGLCPRCWLRFQAWVVTLDG